MNYYTTKEQAKKLANIVSPYTADMSYVRGVENLTPYKDMRDFWSGTKCPVLPCWSAGRLMQLLPSVIEVNGKEYHTEWRKMDAWGLYYVCQGNFILMLKTGDLIEICIAMLEDLKKGGYLDE
jgi:hypothetical protein